MMYQITDTETRQRAEITRLRIELGELQKDKSILARYLEKRELEIAELQAENTALRQRLAEAEAALMDVAMVEIYGGGG